MKAYTLTELVIVVVIAGILAAVVIPMFNSAHDRIKIEAAYRQLMQDIRYVQQVAVARQVSHGISFDTVRESYFAYRQDISNIIKDPATYKPYTVTYASGKFSGIDLVSAVVIEFNSIGAPLLAGSVTISYKGVTKTVSVEENTGRVY